VIESSHILSNPDARGGGIGNANQMVIRDSQIAGNTADEIGGGIGNDGGTNFFIFLVSHARVENTAIENNQAAHGAGIGQAGIFTLTNSIVRNNVASERGGGLSIGNGAAIISDTTVTGDRWNKSIPGRQPKQR
jgi:hypothetical protein